RSIEGFDLAASLRDCSHLLQRHGGHAMAAGLSLDPANLDLFRQRFNEVARARLDPTTLQRTLRLDAEVPLRDLTMTNITSLLRLGPFGNSNPQPQLLIRNLQLAGDIRRLGAEQKHIRFPVSDGSAKIEVLWFNAGEI